MRINPIQQNFNNQNFSARRNLSVDKITVGLGTILATSVLGLGYLTVDKDYYETRKEITQSKIVKLPAVVIDTYVQNFGLENFNIKQFDNNKYEFSSKIGFFEKINGQIYKSLEDENQISGLITKEGLFNNDTYIFESKQILDENKKLTTGFNIKVYPKNNPEKVEIFKVSECSSPDGMIYVNGERRYSREAEETKNIAILLSIIAGLSLFALREPKK